MAKTIDRAEVGKHNSNKDCYMVIEGLVYDVTPFLDEHPGGEEVMLELAGKDATEGFNDVGHSADAKTLLKKYLIGAVPAEEKAHKASKAAVSTATTSGAGGNTITYVMVAVAVVAGAVYNFFLK